MSFYEGEITEQGFAKLTTSETVSRTSGKRFIFLKE